MIRRSDYRPHSTTTVGWGWCRLLAPREVDIYWALRAGGALLALGSLLVAYGTAWLPWLWLIAVPCAALGWTLACGLGLPEPEPEEEQEPSSTG